MASKDIGIKSCTNDFVDPKLTIDDSIFLPVIGEVYYFEYCSRGRCQEFCAEVSKITDSMSIPNTTVIQSYDNCDSCLQENYDSLSFVECIEGFFGKININVSQWDITLPTIGDVYFLTFYTSFESTINQYQGCFIFQGYSNQQGFNNNVFLTDAEEKTDCETCFLDSPIVYSVIECLSGSTYYITFPDNTYDGHLVSFTDSAGLTQYCGIVNKLVSPPVPTTGILVTDLGLPELTGLDCEDCLETVAEKRKIQSCLNPTETEIVWASTLFNVGESTHLSTGAGCYTITEDVVPPESAVTLNELANYAPQEICEDCLECYGLIYDYITCEKVAIPPQPIDIIDTESNSLFGASDMVITSADTLFAVFRSSNKIGEFDLTTQSFESQSNPVLFSPVSLDIDESNNIICVANSNNSTITFFDTTNLNNSYGYVISGESLASNYVYYDPIDGLFYVVFNGADLTTPRIKVLSASTYNSVNQITAFGNSPFKSYNYIIRVGTSFYVSSPNTATIEVYDTLYNLTSTILLPFSAVDIDYDSASNNLYVLGNNNTYCTVNLSTSAIGSYFYSTDCSIFGESKKIKINSSLNKIFITHSNCNEIIIINYLTNTLTNIISGLFDDGISQVLPIELDTSGNTWFGSSSDIFRLSDEGLDFVTGQTASNELLTTGQTFFNPYLNVCCEITNRESSTSEFIESNQYWSMVNYNDCSSCTGQTHETFVCSLCNDDGFGFEAILVAPAGQHTIGDIVRSEFGSSNFLCFEIEDNYNIDDYGDNYPVFETSATSYTTCEDCNNSSLVGLTLVNCDTLQSLTVNVSINDWLVISGFNGIPLTTISDENGVCYQIVNICPIDNDGPTFEVSNFYLNQVFCRLSNQPLLPVSAGTEYLVCNICEGPSGYTANTIVPPHPVWVRPNGQQVTLLDAVALGGMFGLNN
jgi:hypothetical protein